MGNLDPDELEALAERLLEAEENGKPVQPLSRTVELSPEDSYQIQLHGIEKKKKEGATVTGKKIGLTSRGMQEMIGVDQPDYGHLLDTMAYGDGSTIPMNRLIQPRVEAELAFVFDSTLEGPGVTTLDVIEATDAVYPSLEVVDSRVEDWNIEFEDTVADNASSGVYVLGSEGLRSSEIRPGMLREIGMVFRKNNRVQRTGAGAASLGNPVYSLAWLANTLSQFGKTLDEGEVVLSGALSSALDVAAGDYFEANFGEVGRVSCRFV